MLCYVTNDSFIHSFNHSFLINNIPSNIPLIHKNLPSVHPSFILSFNYPSIPSYNPSFISSMIPSFIPRFFSPSLFLSFDRPSFILSLFRSPPCASSSPSILSSWCIVLISHPSSTPQSPHHTLTSALRSNSVIRDLVSRGVPSLETPVMERRRHNLIEMRWRPDPSPTHWPSDQPTYPTTHIPHAHSHTHIHLYQWLSWTDSNTHRLFEIRTIKLAYQLTYMCTSTNWPFGWPTSPLTHLPTDPLTHWPTYPQINRISLRSSCLTKM